MREIADEQPFLRQRQSRASEYRSSQAARSRLAHGDRDPLAASGPPR
jgi:hypothetical protein